MKLSWQEAHLRFTPMKTCEMFCAACSGGRLAGVDHAAPDDAFGEPLACWRRD